MTTILDAPVVGTLDEEGLLPGTSESVEMSGIIIPAAQISASTRLEFTPLDTQSVLHNLHLKSGEQELAYSLSENKQTLIAHAGESGPHVFDLQLLNDGSYHFSLHNPIDRPAPPNLVDNGSLALGEGDLPNQWFTHSTSEGITPISQSIPTQPGAPYQLVFFSLPASAHEGGFSELQVYWDNQHLYSINANDAKGKGFSFSVEGNPLTDHTTLQLVGVGENPLPLASLALML